MQIPHAPQPAMWTRTRRGDAERPVSDTRRDVTGSTEGNKNALKHGCYTAEAIVRRREISGLVRLMKALTKRTCQSI